MKATNRLTLSFLRKHPSDAVQVLEQLPVDMRLSMLSSVDEEDASQLLEHFLPASAGVCLAAMEAEQAGQLLHHIPIASAARILPTMDATVRGEILQHLPEAYRRRIRQALRHPVATVGTIMDTEYFVLPHDLTVGEAIKRLERSAKTISGEIYITGMGLKLAGMVQLDTLFKAGRQLPLRAIMQRHIMPVPVHARLTNLVSRREWQRVRSLPVVDASGAVTGLLHYPALLQAVGENEMEKPAADAFGSMLSIASLYWLAIAQLIDVVITRRPRKASRS